MKKSHTALFGFFMLFIILSSCKREVDKTTELVTTEIPSTKYSKISHVTFYIENSGSMFGYVNGTTEFVNAVNDLAQFPNLVQTETPFSYFLISGKKDFINNKDSLTIYSIGDNPAILRSQLTKKGFDKPSSGNSDLKNMFEIALKKARKDSISILISDGIYDVGGSTNPLTALATEGTLTRTKFIQRLNIDNIETLLIKLESNFNGSYYPANVKDPSGKSETINQKRPYYIWIFGNSDLLKEYFPEERLEELNGYVDLARFRKITKNDFPFEGIGYNNFGFKKDFKTPKTFELYHNVTNSNQFTIAVDFANLNLSNSYLTSTNNYSCSSNNYVVKKISPIGKIPKSEIESYTEMLDFKPSHIITIASKTSQPEIGNMSIALNNRLPNWINESNTGNDYPFDGSTTQTFGFSTLIKGIEEAYLEVSKTKSLAEFNIIIKNN
jgi:hypothetical protein